jgi:hypothetical protein
MKGKRFTEEQIAFALRQAESGLPVVEICRKMEVSEATEIVTSCCGLSLAWCFHSEESEPIINVPGSIYAKSMVAPPGSSTVIS